jgi:hypothetical protein
MRERVCDTGLQEFRLNIGKKNAWLLFAAGLFLIRDV